MNIHITRSLASGRSTVFFFLEVNKQNMKARQVSKRRETVQKVELGLQKYWECYLFWIIKKKKVSTKLKETLQIFSLDNYRSCLRVRKTTGFAHNFLSLLRITENFHFWFFQFFSVDREHILYIGYKDIPAFQDTYFIFIKINGW